MVAFLILFVTLVSFDIIEGTVIYDNFDGLVAVSFVWSVALTVLHFVVPLVRKTPVERSGNILKDLWLGIDLNPRLCGVDLKTFAYRPPMLGYVLVNLSVAFQQYAERGYVIPAMVLFQMFGMWYALDFFWLEHSVVHMYDIIAERFGFMLIWGDYWFITFVFSLGSWVYLDVEDTLTPGLAGGILCVYAVGYCIFRLYVNCENCGGHCTMCVSVDIH